jgi:hypothetical protein
MTCVSFSIHQFCSLLAVGDVEARGKWFSWEYRLSLSQSLRRPYLLHLDQWASAYYFKIFVDIEINPFDSYVCLRREGLLGVLESECVASVSAHG